MTKQYTGSSTKLSTTIANAIKDIANIVNVTAETNDVDTSKIVTITQMMSKQIDTVVEDLKKLGLNPVVLGNGKYVINQYPLEGTKVITGSKVFLLTNETT